MSDKPLFDPNAPSEDVIATSPPEAAQKPAFDPNQPSQDVAPEPQHQPKEFNPSAVQQHVQGNLDRRASENEASGHVPKQASNILEALEAGWDMSVPKLLQQAPDVVLPEHASMFYNILSKIPQTIGDVPAMIAGGWAGKVLGGLGGGAAGSAIPGVGNAAGAAVGSILGGGFGSFALPEGMRRFLMEGYQRGEHRDFSDFWEKASAATIDALKAGTIGAATAGAGGAIGQLGLTGLTHATAQIASEVGAMTVVGSALNKQAPSLQSVIESAIMVGGFHAAGHGISALTGDTGISGTGDTGTSGKTISLGDLPAPAQKTAGALMENFIRTGISPQDTALHAEQNPLLKQELLAVNPNPERIAEQTTGYKQAAPQEPTTEPTPTPSPLPEGKSEAWDIIHSKIGVPEETKGSLPTLNEIKQKKDDLYRLKTDKFDPTKRLMEGWGRDVKETPTEENAFKLMQLTPATAVGRYTHFLREGTLDYATQKVLGESYKNILDDIPKGEQRFAGDYMVSKRVNELLENDKKLPPSEKRFPDPNVLGFSPEAAATVVKEGKEYDPIAKRFTTWREAGTQYAADAGLLDPKALPTWQSLSKSYVDLRRLIQPEETTSQTSKGKPASFLPLTGVDEVTKTQDPLVSMTESTKTLIAQAEQNRARQAFFNMVREEDPEGKMFRQVPGEATVTTAEKNEMKAWMDRNGIEGDPKELVLYRKGQADDNRPDRAIEWVNGKPIVWEGPEYYMQAVKSLDGNLPAQGIFVKLMAPVTSVMKTGYTFSWDFAIRHLERTFLGTNVLNDDNAPVPIKAVVDSLGSLLRHEIKPDSPNPEWAKFLKSGGAGGALYGLEDTFLKKNIESLQDQTGFLDSAYNVLKGGVHLTEFATQMADLSIRMAKAKQIYGDETEGSKIFDAGYSALNANVNYLRSGADPGLIPGISDNKTVAFQNLHIQTLDRVMTGFKDNPQKILSLGFRYITLPTILNFVYNKLTGYQDKIEKELTPLQQDMYWNYHVPLSLVGGQDLTGKIIIPPVLGLFFKVLPERLLKAFFSENPHAFAGLSKTVMNMMVPSVFPDAIKAVSEHALNLNFRTGRPLIPDEGQRLLPAEQYTDYTSETAKAIGKLVGYLPNKLGNDDFGPSSPAIIDNYLHSFGSAGDYAVQAIDNLLIKAGGKPDIRPDYTIYDIPFVKAFFARQPSMSAAPIDLFRERYGDGQKVKNSIQFLKGKGDVEGVLQLMAAHQGDLNQPNRLKQKLDQITHEIKSISTFPNEALSRSDKRQAITKLTYEAIEIATEGNKFMDAIDASMKTRTNK